MPKKVPAARVLEEWTERDLSAAALKGELSPAFEIDEQIDLASDVLSSGRNLLIAGESGVGKTTFTSPTPSTLNRSFRRSAIV